MKTWEKMAVCSPGRGALKGPPASGSISDSGLQEGEDPRLGHPSRPESAGNWSSRRAGSGRKRGRKGRRGRKGKEVGPEEGGAKSTETEALASEGWASRQVGRARQMLLKQAVALSQDAHCPPHVTLQRLLALLPGPGT